MSRCLVPDCENTDGVVAIGGDPELTVKPISENFICSKHILCLAVDEDNANVNTGKINSDIEPFKEEGEENICRVCLAKNSNNNIFDFIEENVTIATAIMLCVHSVKIVEDDLPKNICKSCYKSLKISYEFSKKCRATDEVLHIKYKSRKCTAIEADEFDKNKHINLKSSNICKTFVEENKSTSKQNRSIPCIDDVVNNIEKTMETIHGETTESESEPTVSEILEILGHNAIIEKRGIEDACQATTSVRKPVSLAATLHAQVLPKARFKNLKKNSKYKSTVGKFKGILKTGIYNTPFIQVERYLFEYGLLRGSIRHLRCTTPKCSATGKQLILESGECSRIVEIEKPHNHKALADDMIPKHMFLCWMRMKMQADKTLDIRNIYEDACYQNPDLENILPLKHVLSEICGHQLKHNIGKITSFEMFHNLIDTDGLARLHFTHTYQQFYQEKFSNEEDGSLAVLFANESIVQKLSHSRIMYVDASFKIETNEDFKYQLITVLILINQNYYPVIFVLINKKSQPLFCQIFSYIRNKLAPQLRPLEIITDYEASLYHALVEIYSESTIGGSIFYYTENLYKKICSLNLAQDLETNSVFRNIYHMLLMLPLLPVNTILDALNGIEMGAKISNLSQLARPLFDYVRSQWYLKVTPQLFCVHKVENRINENVIIPFKKLRDFLLLIKGKGQRTPITITYIIEKVIELEKYLQETYLHPEKKSFGRDLISSQKKSVLRAWQYIEEFPKIEINVFFSKVLGYIKCMENQLWIWGFYRYAGDTDDCLINAENFSIVHKENIQDDEDEQMEYAEIAGNTIVMEALVDSDGVLQPQEMKKV